MIHNNRKSPNNIPKPLLDAKEALQELAETGDKILIKASIYNAKRTINKQEIFIVRKKLRDLYYQKCAYCESKEHKPEVEHYRPKKNVAEDNSHPGYYWLCYEWSNLLPSCHNCNTENGKRTQFPIEGKRISLPSFDENNKLDMEKCKAYNSLLIDEQALLFHPEIDHPEKFFRFNKKGKIEGIGNRAIKTVEICDLNRDNLLYNRKKVVDEIVRNIVLSFYHIVIHPADKKGFKTHLKDIFTSLDKACQPQHEFSLLHCFIRDNFILLITNQLPQLQKSVVFAYRNHRINNQIS